MRTPGVVSARWGVHGVTPLRNRHPAVHLTVTLGEGVPHPDFQDEHIPFEAITQVRQSECGDAIL